MCFNNTNLKSILMKKSVTTVGPFTFNLDSDLEVNLSEDMSQKLKIGPDIRELISLSLKWGNANLNEGCFRNCRFEKFNLPDSVEVIGD